MRNSLLQVQLQPRMNNKYQLVCLVVPGIQSVVLKCTIFSDATVALGLGFREVCSLTPVRLLHKMQIHLKYQTKIYFILYILVHLLKAHYNNQNETACLYKRVNYIENRVYHQRTMQYALIKLFSKLLHQTCDFSRFPHCSLYQAKCDQMCQSVVSVYQTQ